MSEDLIKRIDAIKAIEAEECLGYVECQSEWLYDRINAIPSIEVEEMDSTEMAKMVVHKMIDNTTFAEDAYPDIKQKMHDAIENAPIVERKRERCEYCKDGDFIGQRIMLGNDGKWHKIRFCPNCGAHMKGVDDEVR